MSFLTLMEILPNPIIQPCKSFWQLPSWCIVYQEIHFWPSKLALKDQEDHNNILGPYIMPCMWYYFASIIPFHVRVHITFHTAIHALKMQSHNSS